jgi:hypothetical protein
MKDAHREGVIMLNTPAYILLILYSAIIVVSYFVVRRGWRRAYPTFVVGGVANALVAFAFSLMRGNMLLHAVIVGPITGILFVAVSVTMASLFRDSMPSYAAERAAMGQIRAERLALFSAMADELDHNIAMSELSSPQTVSNNTSSAFAVQHIFDEPELGELVAVPNC